MIQLRLIKNLNYTIGHTKLSIEEGSDNEANIAVSANIIVVDDLKVGDTLSVTAGRYFKIKII